MTRAPGARIERTKARVARRGPSCFGGGGRSRRIVRYQPTVTVAVVGAAVCSEELKPPTSSYEKPYESPFSPWSCQNFEYQLAALPAG